MICVPKPRLRAASAGPDGRPQLIFVEAGPEWRLPKPWMADAMIRFNDSGLSVGRGETPVILMPQEAGQGPAVVTHIERGDQKGLRRRAAEALRLLKSHHATACNVVLPDLPDNALQAIVEGVLQANHPFQSVGPAHGAADSIADLAFVCAGAPDAAERAVADGWLTSLAVLTARDLATEPANALTPPQFCAECEALAENSGFELTVMGPAELEESGMNGLLTVAAGSRYDARLVRLDWRPEGLARTAPPLVLVGKTVTFDSGGISLKKPQDMEQMKADMGGGAAVFGAMAALAELRPDYPVTAIFAVVENMPGPQAMRPSDVIRLGSGKTVEIINTDAEGRLILADALHYAAGLSPRAVIDLATLTGASLGIFGPLGIGTFANNDGWFAALAEADATAAERIWRLPLWAEYLEFLKSPVADLRNFSTTGQMGSTPVAATFLSQFIGGHPWLHLDLYNSCWNASETALGPVGPTGSGARVITQLMLNLNALPATAALEN